MSKRATDAAWQLYPDYPSMDGGYITQRKQRELVMKAYEQAEKELALTWEDIRAIDELLTLVYDPNSEKSYYTRVLEEFNRRREEK